MRHRFGGGRYYKRPDGGGSDEEVSDLSQTAEVSTTYVYKLSGTYEGYELMNDLDFNDADGIGSGTEPSKWSKDCVSNCVSGTRFGEEAGNIGWMPIGFYDDNGTNDEADDVDASFTARFHGNEQTISNLYVNRSNDEIIYGGLFGITKDATLDSLELRDVEVKVKSLYTSSYAGGLVGYVTNSSITSCYATGSVFSSVTESESDSGYDSESYAGGSRGIRW